MRGPSKVLRGFLELKTHVAFPISGEVEIREGKIVTDA